jgi:hypothetical protein
VNADEHYSFAGSRKGSDAATSGGPGSNPGQRDVIARPWRCERLRSDAEEVRGTPSADQEAEDTWEAD